jgi:ketosteroid isomerase-like protein
MKLIAAAAAAVSLALVAAPARAADDPVAATAEAVRQADLAFARRSVEVGFARAFQEYADETEGLLYGFEGPPIVGSDAIYKALGGDAPSRWTVDWKPTRWWGSRGGDMGVTVGEYVRTPTTPDRPVLTGRYVTVWRKDAAGQWKALVDIGEADPVKPAAATP